MGRAMTVRYRPCFSLLPLVLVLSCASDQKAPTQAEVADGQALPVPPPVPPQPASTDSPATAPPSVIEAASASKVALPASAASPSEPEALTEGQVAFFADLANSSEVEQGKLAQGKAKSPAVKKFAAMMVQHHSEALREQAALFKKLNLTATDSASASALKAEGEKTLANLKSASGADFDQTYVAAQVDAHQKVLDAIDQKLLPAARSAELEAGLRKMRATVEAHLSQAKTLLGRTAR
jgi:putative membrane protein